MMNPPAPRSRPRRSTDFDLIVRARATLDDALRRQAGFGRRRPGVALAAMAPEPDCDVNGDRVDCDHPDPGVPSVSFPKPQGWPQEISRSASGARYHDYNHRFDYGQGGDATANQGETEARFNPTPGEHDRPATPQGTPNDAGWIARHSLGRSRPDLAAWVSVDDGLFGFA